MPKRRRAYVHTEGALFADGVADASFADGTDRTHSWARDCLQQAGMVPAVD